VNDLSGNVESLQIRAEATVGKQNTRTQTATYANAQRAHTYKAMTEIESNVETNSSSSRSQTSLSIATAKGDEQVARLLLENGASFKEQDENGRTILHVAA
jgi:ankyrin repeat protein